jgi:hypothetical protein
VIFKLTRRLPRPLRIDYRSYAPHNEHELDIGYVSLYWSDYVRDPQKSMYGFRCVSASISAPLDLFHREFKGWLREGDSWFPE